MSNSESAEHARKKKERIYFPGLNGLRGIAALLVVFGHFHQVVVNYNLIPLLDPARAQELATHAVRIFFVLSGFLLTYLLLAEKYHHQTISIRSFYIRRLLRIWPLYYLIIIFAFCVYPELPFMHLRGFPLVFDNSVTHVLLLIFMQPHIAYYGFGFVSVPTVVLWSIGIEETFYLFWPVLLLLFKRSLIPILSILLVFTFFPTGVGYVLNSFARGHISDMNIQVTTNLATVVVFNPMAFGALAAYLVFQVRYKDRFQSTLGFLNHPVTGFFSLLSIVLIWIYHDNSFIIHRTITYTTLYALYALLLLHLATAKRRILPFENRLMNFLGRISYGIYMYHYIILALVVEGILINSFSLSTDEIAPYSILVLLSVVLLTIGISYISYRYFERKVLRFKLRFEQVKSGNTKDIETT